VRLAEPLLHQPLRAGTRCCSSRVGYVYERIPRPRWRSSSRGSAGHLLPRHRCLAGQIEQIRDAVELPYLHADLFKEHRLRPPRASCSTGARLRQDADRQGGGELAGQEGRGKVGGCRAGRQGGEELLPQHQGPGVAEQVRRRNRAAHQAGLSAGQGEGQRGHAGHRVLRRDGLDLPHPRLGRVLRRGEHDRAAAAVEIDGVEAWRTSSSSAPPTART